MSRPEGTARPKRRALLTSAAWAAPAAAVAVATPAYAASPCTELRSYSMNFRSESGWTRQSISAGRAVVPVPGSDPREPDIVLTVGSELLNATGTTYARLDNSNGQNFGPYSTNGIEIFQSVTGTGISRPSASSAYGQRVTLTFDRSVRNLRFRIDGFTRNTGSSNYFTDAVWVSGSPTAVKNSNSANQVSGSGTAADPWAAPTAGSVEGNYVDLTYPGPIQTVAIHYLNSAGRNTTQQAVNILNLQFESYGAIGC